MEGTISRLMDKGYGFIKTPEGDLFFHASELNGGFEEFETLEEGMSVEFETIKGQNDKFKAVKVRII